MKLKTTFRYQAKPEQLWPLLFNSKMDSEQPCNFLYGLPKPVECRLQDSEGGVGKTRECVSDKGVDQTEYIGLGTKFEIEIRTKGNGYLFWSVYEKYQYFISIPLYICLKSIHRYVFRNWDRIIGNHNRIKP